LKFSSFCGYACLSFLLLGAIGILWSFINYNWLVNAINAGIVPGRGPERDAVEFGLWFEIPRYIYGISPFGMLLFGALYDLLTHP
jgi:hypothetical protein